jgi:hypothetical protein
VAALSFDEKGFVLGAALARMPAPDAPGRVSGAAGPRCAAALAALAETSRASRAAEIAALAALVRAPVPAGIERIHPDWLRERFEPETGDVLRAIAAGLPDEVRRLVSDVLRARGEEAHRAGPVAGVQAVAALQRVVFAGLVPLTGAGAPTTALARELAALAPADLVRAIEMRGAETLGRSLRGAPPPVLARAAASVGQPLAAVVLDAARGDGEPTARDRARRLVAAAGVAPAGQATLGIGLHALADALGDEGDAAILAVAQRLPPEVGRRLLAAANGSG